MKTKQWLAGLMALFLLLSPLTESEARDLKVGVMEGDPQFFYMRKDNEPYGYAFEYMQLLSQYRDWQVIFLPGTVDECRSRLLSGTIDVIAGLPPGQGREFTLSPLSMSLLQRNFLQPLHLTVSSARPALSDEILSAEQKMRLEYPHVLDYLNEKYFHHESTQAPLVLTLKEKDFLKEHPVLRLALPSGSFPMLEERDGKLVGLDAELLERISSDLNVKLQLVRVNNRQEAYEALKEGKADLVTGTPMDFAWAQKNGFYLTTSYTRANYLEVTQRGETGQAGRVALPQGLLASNTLTRNLEEKDILWCHSPEECLDAVRDGRAARTYMEAYSAQYQIFHNGYYDLAATGDIACSLDIALVVPATPEGRQLLSVLNHEINSLPSNFQEAMDTRGIFRGKMQTFSAFVYNYPMQVFTGLMALILSLCLIFFYLLHMRRRHIQEVQHTAYTDYWSELPNWRWFVDEMPHLLRGELRQATEAGHCYVLRVDIESINQLSIANRKASTAQQLPRILKELQTQLQLRATAVSGMAKMIMALGEMAPPKDSRPPLDILTEQVANALRSIIRQETALKLQAVNLKGGICRLEKAEDFENAVHRAELAISEAYESGKMVCVYDANLEKQLARRHMIEAAMEQALKQREFQVWLQPKYDLLTRNTLGAEALVRWNSPELGFLPPGAFMDIFERNGFAVELDYYVLERVCEIQSARLKKNLPTLPISVNQSGLHLTEQGYLGRMRSLMDRWQLIPGLIELEITETAFIDFTTRDQREDAAQIIDDLQEIGFSLSMDDFCTGYSSLSMLQNLPMNVMKIDRSVLWEAEKSPRSMNILHHVIALGKALSMNVLVEGIESEEQEKHLLKLGCDSGHGYFYARPMPVKEFYEEFLPKHS